MVCRKCRGTELVRIKRRGFLRGRILPRFGFYPWRCNTCGTERVYHARSNRNRTAPLVQS
jgi:hypothetical protein